MYTLCSFPFFCRFSVVTSHVTSRPLRNPIQDRAEDVDYIDIPDTQITNPARLLPLESVHPFWAENRRRKQQFYKLFELVEKVSSLIEEYEDYLHIPIGSQCCAERWENQLSDIVWDAYSEMHEAIDDVMFAFNEKFHRAAWLLFDYHGCTSQEFQAKLEEEDRAKYRIMLYNAFLQDLEKRCNTNVIQEDLPF